VLVVLQGTAVGAWCFLCLATAAISLMLVALAYDEVWSSILYLRRVAKKTGDARAVWRAFWKTLEGGAERRDPRAKGRVMWPRVVELMLGCWLASSPFVFRHPDGEGVWGRDLVGAFLVIGMASLSFWQPARRAHFGILPVALWLGVAAFLRPAPTPPALQNDLIVSVILAMLAILPNRADLPPRGLRTEG
jgi:hypothetical protein